MKAQEEKTIANDLFEITHYKWHVELLPPGPHGGYGPYVAFYPLYLGKDHEAQIGYSELEELSLKIMDKIDNVHYYAAADYYYKKGFVVLGRLTKRDIRIAVKSIWTNYHLGLL